MKRFIYIIVLLFFTGLISSCNDWLNQTPHDKIPGDELYATESGTEEVLNGLYLGLAERSLYGGELTVGMIEALAEHYAVPANHRYKDLVDYAYGTNASKAYFSSVWNGMYRQIANCNVFLEQIAVHQGNYNPENYKLFRGEALALRTFLHFDLYRLFAPAYTEENKTQRAIPYYDKETDTPTPYLTGEEIMNRLLEDADEAIALLDKDPVLNLDTLSFQADGNKAVSWQHRHFRFNVYAVQALKARMYLHTGDKPAAYAIASALLNGQNPAGGTNNFNTAFPSIMRMPSKYRDVLCFSEVIFGMHDINRESMYRRYFSLDLATESILLAGEKWRTEKYGSNMLDMRYRGFGEAADKSETETMLAVLKYQKKSLVASDPYTFRNELVPLIRKGELYLIAAEASPSDTEKEHWLEALVINRGGYQLGDVTGDLDAYIDLEYNRELYAEGQYFYYLKWNGVTSLMKQDATTKNVSAGYFVLPVPDAENDNRVD